VTARTDVIVVGGGIMGLAFAWEAARHGRRVTLLERGDAARGASIRNFGMVWPVGQPAGDRHAMAMQSRARWLELRDAGAVWAAECGSVHVVFEDDEAAVLAEFADRAPALGVPCELLDGPEAARRFPGIAADPSSGARASSRSIRRGRSPRSRHICATATASRCAFRPRSLASTCPG